MKREPPKQLMEARALTGLSLAGARVSALTPAPSEFTDGQTNNLRGPGPDFSSPEGIPGLSLRLVFQSAVPTR